MDGKIFISHSSVDKEIAMKLVAELERHGINCWISGRDIRPGEDYQSVIPAAIEAAPAFLLLFSKNALSSPEIPKELALAGKCRKKIVPARVEDIVPVGAFAFQLTNAQFIDLFEDYNRKISELCAYLAEVCGDQSLKETIENKQQSNAKKRTFSYLLGALVGCVAIAGVIWQSGMFDRPKQDPAKAVAAVSAEQPPKDGAELPVAPLSTMPPPASSGEGATSLQPPPAAPPVEPQKQLEPDNRVDGPAESPMPPAVIAASTAPGTPSGGRYELTRENKGTLPIFVYSAAEDDRNQRVAKTLKLALQDAGFATTDNKKTAALEIASTVLGVDAPTMDTSHTFVQWNSVARLDVKARWTGSGPVLLAEEIAESGGSKEREEAQINALRASISSAVKRLDGLAR